MNVVHINSVVLKGDAISGVMHASNALDRASDGKSSRLIVDSFSELPNVLPLAYKDYEERQNLLLRLKKFMKVGNKAHWLALYLNALRQYRPQIARKAIEGADVRVWHYGGFYSLFRQFHVRDILFYHGITSPYMVENPETPYVSYRSLPTLRSLNPTIIVTSEFMKGDLISQGFDPGAFRVLPLFHTRATGANPRPTGKRGSSVLAYGRYAKNKAVPELARLCSEAGLGLTHFGDNSTLKEFRDEYRKARKYESGTIRILPKQPRIENFFNDAGIYACNSYHEGFNMPAVESMARSLPVLLRRGTGMDELITDGKEGFFFDDVSEIPDLADRIYGNYRSFSLNAWKRSRYYSMDNYKTRYLRILKEARGVKGS
jgi:glycosyltransferase involved in cell wall biosynthesis